MFVLIIEDESVIAYDLAEIIEEAVPATALIARTEDEAVQLAASKRPHLIISDHNLKKGTGPGAVQRIAQLYGPVPTIFLTATPELCTPHGAHLVMGKPLSEVELRNHVQAIFSAVP